MLKFYGRPGERNGVRVVVNGATAPGMGGGSSLSGRKIDVGINLQNIATALGGRNNAYFAGEVAGAVIHEGQHGLDQKRFGTWDTKAAEFDAERRAYTTEAFADQGMNYESTFKLWTREGGVSQQAITDWATQSTIDWAAAWCAAGGPCQ